LNRTFLALLLCAVGVWGYVVFRVVMILIGGGGEPDQAGLATGATAAAVMLARPRPPLDTSFRDPFQSYLYAQKPAPVIPKLGIVRTVAKLVEAPKAVLTGILWGDEPVAILKQDGQTELVKQGASVWDFTVVRIEKTRVMIRKQGRAYTLEY
jgi:hypothetical protein